MGEVGVGDDQIVRLLCRLSGRQPRLAVVYRDQFVAFLALCPSHQLPHGGLIVHDQNALTSGGWHLVPPSIEKGK
jgi:hypothetical protein